MGSLLVAIPLNKLSLPLPAIIKSWMFGEGQRPYEPLPPSYHYLPLGPWPFSSHDRAMTGSILCRSCTSNLNCCATAGDVLRRELHLTPLAFKFFPSYLPKSSLHLGGSFPYLENYSLAYEKLY